MTGLSRRRVRPAAQRARRARRTSASSTSGLERLVVARRPATRPTSGSRPPPRRASGSPRAAFAGLPRRRVRVELDRTARRTRSRPLAGRAGATATSSSSSAPTSSPSFLTLARAERACSSCVRLGVATRPGYRAATARRGARALERPERVEFFEIEPAPRRRRPRSAPASPAASRSTVSSRRRSRALIATLGLYRTE